MDNNLKKVKEISFFPIIVIFLIALLFRLFKLSEHPVSLSMDEVAIGYNAYSILKTGKDEWGEKFPIAFKSVGDYKPPINIYLTVPSIYIFGLNEFGVRLPTALLGSLSVIVVILLLKELGFSNIGYYFGGFFLAVLPWHVHFSRASFEAVTALFFLTLGLYAFIRSVHVKSNLLFLISIIALSLSVWSYHSERVFVPLLFLFLIFLYRSKLLFILRSPKKLFFIIVFSLIFILPFIYLTLFTEAVRTRALSTSVFREQNLIRALHYGLYNTIIEQIFDNDVYLIFRHIAGKYLNYFDARFWFWKGLYYTPLGYFDMGLFYFIDAVAIFVGIYLLFRSKNNIVKSLAVFWLFVGPLPAAVTMNEQHPLRVMHWIPFFVLAAAKGAEFVVKKVKLHQLLGIYIPLLTLNVFYFTDIYFRQFPRFFSEYWQYGYKEIALYTCQNINKYKNIYISETFGTLGPLNTGTPYLYYLFYCKYDPKEFLRRERLLDPVKFQRVSWNEGKVFENSLLIGSVWDLPLDQIPQNNIVKLIDYPNGKPAFIFVETSGK